MTDAGAPREEFPSKWQAKGSIAVKSNVPGWTWMIESCPVKRTAFHIAPRQVDGAGIGRRGVSVWLSPSDLDTLVQLVDNSEFPDLHDKLRKYQDASAKEA